MIMAGIQFLSTNPAINQFNAQVQRGNQARRLEEEDFMRRFQMERGIGLDHGIRDVFGRAAAQPASAVAGAPAAPATPAIASYTAQPPQAAPMSPSSPTDLSIGFGGDVPRLSEAEMAARMGAPSAGATTPVPQPVATPAPSARAPARSGGPRSYRDVMSGLAKVPGAGSAMMNLYSAERKDSGAMALEERKLHMEGIKLFTDASKNGNVATMRAVSQRYNLGIPPEALNRREIMATIAAGTNTAKGYGITDDESALSFGMAYTQALAGGADPYKAQLAGFEAAKKAKGAGAGFKPKHWFVGPDNTVQAAGEDMLVRSTGAKARPPQPPFALTPGGTDSREQALMNTAFDNAVRGAGRMWLVMLEQEQNDRVQREVARLRSKGGAAPAAAPAKRLKFDAQGNQVQ